MQLLTDTKGKKYWKLSQEEFKHINQVLHEAAKVEVGWGIDEAVDYFEKLSNIDGKYSCKRNGLLERAWHTVPRKYCEQKIIKYLTTQAQAAFKKLCRKNFRFADLLKGLYVNKLIYIENSSIVLSDELSKRTLLTLYSNMPTDDFNAKNNSWTSIDILFDFQYPCKALTSHLGYSKRFLKKYGNHKLISWFY